MAGRGRGRGRKKRPKTEALPAAASSGAADAEEVVATENASRSMMLATPLGALMRIEATIMMNARGGGSMSFDDFYALSRSHEWLGLCHKSNSNGGKTEQSSLVAPTKVSKVLFNLSNDVYELINKLSEEERLLFDFAAVAAWKSEDFPNLYALYRLHTSPKIKLEILQQQQPKESKSATTKAKSSKKIATRSEILGKMYYHSRKFFFIESTVGSASALHNWWEHAKSAAQMILDHRESMTASSRNGGSVAGNPSFKSLMTNEDEPVVTKSPTKLNGDKKLTLEERVRARSLRNPTTVKQNQSSKKAAESSAHSENKVLLELADALRSYSQRRGLGSSGGGGSALDRLKNRGAVSGSGGAHAAKNIARLTMLDLIKDARVTWNSVVNESIDRHDSSSGSKSRGGGASPMVNVDLSRVLFQLRLKMVSSADVSDKRQMELQLLALIDKLATVVPKWIHLRATPSTLISKTKPRIGTSTKQENAATSNHKLNIKQSIIVIRNDSVDYSTEVRAKLGGRVHNPAGSTLKSDGRRKTGATAGSKRSLQVHQPPQNEVHGPVVAADAIVPPSFRRLYEKALDEEPKIDGK